MSTRLRAAFLAALIAAPAGVLAADECDRPEPPIVPDGATATQEQLATAGSDVRAFVASSQDYLACLEAKEAGYGKDITPVQQALVNAVYNAGVEAMEAAAGAYNEAVRAYRARDEN